MHPLHLSQTVIPCFVTCYLHQNQSRLNTLGGPGPPLKTPKASKG